MDRICSHLIHIGFVGHGMVLENSKENMFYVEIKAIFQHNRTLHTVHNVSKWPFSFLAHTLIDPDSRSKIFEG